MLIIELSVPPTQAVVRRIAEVIATLVDEAEAFASSARSAVNSASHLLATWLTMVVGHGMLFTRWLGQRGSVDAHLATMLFPRELGGLGAPLPTAL